MRLCVGCSLAGGLWRRWGNGEFGDGVCHLESFGWRVWIALDWTFYNKQLAE